MHGDPVFRTLLTESTDFQASLASVQGLLPPLDRQQLLLDERRKWRNDRGAVTRVRLHRRMERFDEADQAITASVGDFQGFVENQP